MKIRIYVCAIILLLMVVFFIFYEVKEPGSVVVSDKNVVTIHTEKCEPLLIWDYVDGSAVALCDGERIVLINQENEILRTIIDNSSGKNSFFYDALYGNATKSKHLLSFDNNSFVIIDRMGNELSPKFEYVQMSNDGASIFVRLNEQYYFVDSNGIDVNNGKRWDHISGFFDMEEMNNCCVVRENGLCGITNGNGQYIIEPKYDDIKIDIVTGDMYGIFSDGGIEILKESDCF